MKFWIGFIIVGVLFVGACGGDSGSVSQEERREVFIDAFLEAQPALTRQQAECTIDRFIAHGVLSREELDTKLSDADAIELGIEVLARCDIRLSELD